MKVVVAGTGYVGLVTGVVLAHIGHNVTCLDTNTEKIKLLNSGVCPIYEPDLSELMLRNKERLKYTTEFQDAYANADVIFIAVGTPENTDGSANLKYVKKVVEQIAENVMKNVIIVIKSTVPIGTNDKIDKYFHSKCKSLQIEVVSNPEFLSQGSAVHDSLYASRIIVGVTSSVSASCMKQLYYPLTISPYNVPYLEMSRQSAEMVKYASNNFLALKISYINEIANFCELEKANIDEVVEGMSYDERIGKYFLKAGLGYGGSCFPKDTNALYFNAKSKGVELKTVKASIEINCEQQLKLYKKIKKNFQNLKNLTIAVLGVTFKPTTDDLRQAPSIRNIELLLKEGCKIYAYDPVGLPNLKKIFNTKIIYCNTIDDCIENADAIMIMTEWKEIKEYRLENYAKLKKRPKIYDGRNCYNVDQVSLLKIPYYSIGRGEI